MAVLGGLEGVFAESADRIFVLSPRPTRIQATFDVRIPHPRRLTSPEAQELRAAVLRELGVEE